MKRATHVLCAPGPNNERSGRLLLTRAMSGPGRARSGRSYDERLNGCLFGCPRLLSQSIQVIPYTPNFSRAYAHLSWVPHGWPLSGPCSSEAPRQRAFVISVGCAPPLGAPRVAPFRALSFRGAAPARLCHFRSARILSKGFRLWALRLAFRVRGSDFGCPGLHFEQGVQTLASPA